MPRKSHPKKEVEAALRHAESKGCTPKNPANHGKQLRRVVDNCVGDSPNAEE